MMGIWGVIPSSLMCICLKFSTIKKLKKGKRLVKEHVWMIHGHGQLWELTVVVGGGMGEGEQRGKNWDNCNRTTIKKRKWWKP